MANTTESTAEKTLPVVRIEPITMASATYVAAHMRDKDVDELTSFLPGVDPVQMVAYMAQSDGWHFTAWVDGNPEFCFGIGRQTGQPQIGTLWGVGTDRTKSAIWEITRFGRRGLIPNILDTTPDIHRIEVRVKADYTDSINWIEKGLLARRDCLLQGYGGNAEDFILFSWTRETLKKDYPDHVRRLPIPTPGESSTGEDRL